MQTRYPRHQITQSVFNIPPPQITVVRSISPVVVRTLEVPIYYHNDQTIWKDKYYELRHQYWLLEDKCSKLEDLQFKHSRCEVVRESDLKQINELYTQSQHDIRQLKNCLANVDTQMNEDYQFKYQQANHQLETIKSEFIKLQQELYQSQQQSTQETQRYPQQINQLIISNTELQRQYEQLLLKNKNLQQQIDTLHIRLTESGNQYNKIQELLALIVLKNAEIDSLRVLVSEKENLIQQLRSQYLYFIINQITKIKLLCLLQYNHRQLYLNIDDIQMYLRQKNQIVNKFCINSNSFQKFSLVIILILHICIIRLRQSQALLCIFYCTRQKQIFLILKYHLQLYSSILYNQINCLPLKLRLMIKKQNSY